MTSDQKNSLIRRTVIAAVVAALVAMAALIVFFIGSKPDPTPQLSESTPPQGTAAAVTDSTPAEPSTKTTEPTFDGVFQSLPNGDSYYTPDPRHLVTDAERTILYYNDLLLVFTDGDLAETELGALAQSVDGNIVGVVSGGIHSFQILVLESTLTELEALAETLMQNEQVLYACGEYPVQIMEAKDNNPWYPDGTEDKGNEANPDGPDWWAEAIGAYTAWEYSNLCQEIRIGVVDNGFLTDHEDLTSHIVLISHEANNSAANHGTMVAGIIGAANNNVGIRGVADSATLYCADLWPLDSPDSYHTLAEYLATINCMAQNGVRVVNNSWGCVLPTEDTWLETWGSYSGAYSQFMDQRLNQDLIPTAEYCIVMISQLISSGYGDMIHVQAAGNDSMDARYSGFFCRVTEEVYNGMAPSLLKKLADAGITYEGIDARILVVGAVENVRDNSGNYQTAYFTNWGDTVDICAPGHIVYTTMSFTPDAYGAEGGTSLAAPMVTGSVAYLWSLDPELTVSELRQLLLSAPQSKAIGVGNCEGWSCPMLNIGTAVQRLLEDTD